MDVPLSLPERAREYGPGLFPPAQGCHTRTTAPNATASGKQSPPATGHSPARRKPSREGGVLTDPREGARAHSGGVLNILLAKQNQTAFVKCFMKYAQVFRQVKCLNQLTILHLNRVGILC